MHSGAKEGAVDKEGEVDNVKQFHRTAFWVVSVFMAAVASALGVAIYFGLEQVAAAVATDAGKTWLVNEMPAMVMLLQDRFYLWVLPAVTGIILLLGWILWFIL
ncbi:MAG: hypothetical protein LC657_16870, partial [Desulfobacteraceae bacterium]|nr:hypothetical protein [Desulfobacteraceae bacterium]